MGYKKGKYRRNGLPSTHRVKVSLNELEYNYVIKTAKDIGLSMSEYIKRKLFTKKDVQTIALVEPVEDE